MRDFFYFPRKFAASRLQKTIAFLLKQVKLKLFGPIFLLINVLFKFDFQE